MNKKEPMFIKGWDELMAIKQESETHILEIDREWCNGWLKPKDKDLKGFEGRHYLSTHTFYGGTHEWSTKILQECGFNVVLDNWDKNLEANKEEEKIARRPKNYKTKNTSKKKLKRNKLKNNTI